MIEIKIRFAAGVVRWVRERQHYGFQSEENNAVMIYHVEDVSEIRAWILSWGDAAEVLSPKELRKSMRETALKLANMLT